MTDKEKDEALARWILLVRAIYSGDPEAILVLIGETA